METEDAEEQKKSQNRGNPASARDGDSNSRENDQRSIAYENFANMIQAAGESEGESKRQ